MELDGEEGCERNETSLIASRHMPERRRAELAVAFVSLLLWMRHMELQWTLR